MRTESLVYYLLVLMLSITLPITWSHGSSTVLTHYAYRPQSLNSARKVAGEIPGSLLVHKSVDRCDEYGYGGAALEYTQSFNNTAIANAFFCPLLTQYTPNKNCKNGCESALLVQGMAIQDRNPKALRAEDLYLGQDFNSTLLFSPQISNFIVDLQWYIGLDQHLRGAYCRLYAPFVHTQWTLGMSEIINTPGTTVTTGSFSSNAVASSSLLPNATSYFQGVTPTSFTFAASATDPATTYTCQRAPLTATKIKGVVCNSNASCVSHHALRQNGFGDIRAEFGWNFFDCSRGAFGINIQAAAPTGTQVHATWLLQPIVGNQRHWELGAGIVGHARFFECTERHAGIYLDGMVTHLFANTQERTFDLVNRPLSRYALAVLHTPAYLGSLAGSTSNENTNNTTPALYQVANQYTPVANLTTHKVRVRVNAQADISLWCNYTSGSKSFDLGYNIYARTAETITCSLCPPRLATEPLWALKGDAHTYGFAPSDYTNATYLNSAFPLSISEATASITSPNVLNNQNSSVDNPQYAVATPDATNKTFLMSNPNTTSATTSSITRISMPPVFLQLKDISYTPTQRIITQKVFAHWSHAFEHHWWTTFVGVGGEVEWGMNSSCKTQCATGKRAACTLNSGTSQWGLWCKLGFCYE